MMRAVRLAERNQILEAELKDVDGVAMSVEASCNTALRESSHHVTKLQVTLFFSEHPHLLEPDHRLSAV